MDRIYVQIIISKFFKTMNMNQDISITNMKLIYYNIFRKIDEIF